MAAEKPPEREKFPLRCGPVGPQRDIACQLLGNLNIQVSVRRIFHSHAKLNQKTLPRQVPSAGTACDPEISSQHADDRRAGPGRLPRQNGNLDARSADSGPAGDTPASHGVGDRLDAAVPGDLRAFKLSDTQVLRDRVRLLLASIPLALVSSYLAAGMTAWLLYPAIASAKLVAWLSLLGFVHVVRVFAWYKARGTPPDASLHRYLSYLRIGVFATAMTWAALPLFLYPSAEFDQLRLAVVIGAICGAGASELASDAVSAGLFVLPALTAMVVRLLTDPLPAMQLLGGMAAIYELYLVKAARRTERLFLEISYLRAKAADKISIDEVTGLPNRIGLNRQLGEAIVQAQLRHAPLAVGYLDVDDFKVVNDTHGHAVGDQLLKELGRRLRSGIRDQDSLARISGDEFVIVVPGFDAEHFADELQSVAHRLHQAIKAPFTLDDGRSISIEMTMGVARYPADARDADALLRVADAAMYQGKRRKGERTSWWQLGVSKVVAPEVDVQVDPYGDEAARRLEDVQSLMPQVVDQFIGEFERTVEQDVLASPILRSLDSQARHDLQHRYAAYLATLVSPSLKRTDLLDAARGVGQVHSLVGVNAAMLVKASELFRDVLDRRLASEKLVPSRRLRLFKVIEARVRDDLQQQVSVIEQINQSYLSFLSRERPAHGALWADGIRAELAALVSLPGIVMVTLSRLSARGELVLEHSAGVPDSMLVERLSNGDLRSSIDPTSPSGRTATSIAWRTQVLHRIDTCGGDARTQAPGMRAWHEMARRFGIQSNVGIPFAGRNDHVEGVLTIYGEHPHQFASPWMQEWSLGVQRRLETVWSRCSAARSVVVSEELALAYRDRLFSGGLEMYYQPIVDLQTGKIAKVEALARLQMQDGLVVAPGAFIPLLGDSELARVFREGLQQSLSALRTWDAQGLSLAVSLNLPPSVLNDPQCADWIEEALREHGIAAQRLMLELLEEQQVDDAAQSRGLDRLRALEVGFAMDDFGSGYSNVHRLSSVRFDTIKIDQNLTRQLEASPLQNMTLFASLIQLVRDLGKSVIVEGLETAAHVEAAVVLGAQFGQGYALARPMPAAAIKPWADSFGLPVATDAAVLTTDLGALAFQWQYNEVGGGLHPMSTTHCPLHRFLIERGLADSDAAKWHAELHNQLSDADGASRRLTRWLADRVADSAPELAAAPSA